MSKMYLINVLFVWNEVRWLFVIFQVPKNNFLGLWNIEESVHRQGNTRNNVFSLLSLYKNNLSIPLYVLVSQEQRKSVLFAKLWFSVRCLQQQKVSDLWKNYIKRTIKQTTTTTTLLKTTLRTIVNQVKKSLLFMLMLSITLQLVCLPRNSFFTRYSDANQLNKWENLAQSASQANISTHTHIHTRTQSKPVEKHSLLNCLYASFRIALDLRFSTDSMH